MSFAVIVLVVFAVLMVVRMGFGFVRVFVCVRFVAALMRVFVFVMRVVMCVLVRVLDFVVRVVVRMVCHADNSFSRMVGTSERRALSHALNFF